jgi:hypothetical protein
MSTLFTIINVRSPICCVCLVVLSFYVVYFILEGFNVYEVISNTSQILFSDDQPTLTAQTTGMRHHKAWCFAWVFHNNIATAEHIPNTSSLILNIIEKVDSTLAGGIAFTKNLKTVAFGRNCNSTHFSYQLYTHDDGIELKLKLSYQICRPSDDREPVPRVRDFRRGEICNAFPKYWSFPLTSLFPFSATSASPPSTNL